MTVAEGLERVRERILTAGGDLDRVRIVAVTKGHPVETVQEVLAAGVADVGESYAQELVRKADRLAEGPIAPRWHFVGNLQRNKVRQVAGCVHLWHSLDRLSLAGEIAARAPGASVLVQVNVAGEAQQGGCPPARVAAVVDGARDLGLQVLGLMAIGPRGSQDEVRAAFRTVRALADRLELPERSMGMSGDLEAAVAEGSTLVRIGTDLVGPRPDPPTGPAAVGK